MQQYCETILNGTPKYTPLNGAGLKFLNLEKSLIICADDFALNDAVSDAIISLASKGRISATSALTLSPFWPAHARQLKAQGNLCLDVGLHLDLTSEFARDAGYGADLNQVLLKAVGFGYHSSSMDSIIASQLDRFESVWGAPPDHIDGHQHIHQFAGIRNSLIRVLRTRYPSTNTRPWVRVSNVRPINVKSSVISLTGAKRLRGLLENDGINFSPVLLGVYGFNLNKDKYRAAFLPWLNLVDGIEESRLMQVTRHKYLMIELNKPTSTALPPTIMCHPSMLAQEGDSIGQARTEEFAYFDSEAFKGDLSASLLTLVRGTQFIQKANN